MKKVNHNQLSKLIVSSYKSKLPLFIHGASGIGKSQEVKRTAKKISNQKKKEFLEWNKISHDQKRELLHNGNVKNKFIFADIRSAELDPTEIKGLPNFYNGVVEWKANLLFKVLSNPDTDGIIFFDEINLAMPSILASMYKIILDREVGDLSLSEHIGIIAGGNRPEDQANVFKLPMPLANRFLHIELRTPDKNSWVTWAFKHNIDNRIISFIEWKASYLYRFNKKTSEYTFATPRMWEFLSRLIYGKKLSLDELEIIACSTIGEGVATEFIAFLKVKDKLDIDKILKNPRKVKKITELSQKYALVTGLSEKVLDNPTELKLYQSIMKTINYLEEEFKIILMRYLRKNGIEGVMRKRKIKSSDEAQLWLIKNIFNKIPEWTKNLSRFRDFLTF